MKLKKNKKFYNFTAKQKRKDRSLKCMHFHTVGKEFKVMANRKFRRDNNVILRTILTTEKDKSFVRHCKYMWWDM